MVFKRMTPGFLHLTVLSREEAILVGPRNISVVEGEDATFSCRTHLDLHRYVLQRSNLCFS